MLKKGFSLSLVLAFSLTVSPLTSNAYILSSDKLLPPQDLYYWIDPAFSATHISEVTTGIKAWNVTPEIQFVQKVSLAGGAEVKIERSNTSKGTVVGTSYGGGHIILWSGWRGLSTATKRKETVVHEVGHELGLAHTQESNILISVMRTSGFNSKAYPLSDDKAGIAKKY